MKPYTVDNFLNEKESLPYPLYSKNGTHWSYYGMCLAADTLIRFIEEKIEAPVDIISTGPDREETIILNHPFN